MKTLIILRHAKTEPHNPGRDHERELTARGRRDADRIGAYLAENDIIPDFILCSDAARAQQTLNEVAPHLPKDIPTRIERKFYDAESSALFQNVRDVDDASSKVMLVGHNPGLENLARGLIGDTRSAKAMKLREKFPTAAVAVIDFDIPRWSDLAWSAGQLDDFAVPADL
jgi:phosphohistidine phosphatase